MYDRCNQQLRESIKVSIFARCIIHILLKFMNSPGNSLLRAAKINESEQKIDENEAL